MCYHVPVIMHVKDLKLSVVRVGHHVQLAGFCLSLYSLHVLNTNVDIIQSIIPVVDFILVTTLKGLLVQ